jgi:fructose-1,6-bisphosphatase/sedoheptulose 1,7-bisphosphatase-like protein
MVLRASITISFRPEARRKFISRRWPATTFMFAATGVYLHGVRLCSGGAMTNSVVMRSKTRTIRFIEAIHHFDFKPEY